MKRFFWVVRIAITTVLLFGAFPVVPTDITVRLEPIDESRRHEYGERYHPGRYYKCRHQVAPQETTCDVYKLRRHTIPAHFPHPELPPPRLPEPPEDSGYRWWMGGDEYFHHLCRHEAGKFIYRKIENVEGVFQMRPRQFANDHELTDRYVMEDPYGYTIGEARYPGFDFVGRGQYRFFETTLYDQEYSKQDRQWYHPEFFPEPDGKARYIRYFGHDGNEMKTMVREYITTLKSRYGYFWRDIPRPKDREHRIAGGELVVIDLETNEVLAIWRGFMRGASWGHLVYWSSGQSCPPKTGMAQQLYDFLSSVLIPAPNP